MKPPLVAHEVTPSASNATDREWLGRILESLAAIPDRARGEPLEPEVMHALREAAVAIDRVRGMLQRPDADEVLAHWGALLSGHWSLLVAFERDGRRYLLARRNEHPTGGRRALSRREAQVTAHAALGRPYKSIAHDLGLAPSTVATHLAAALRKLGLSSRRELVRLLGNPGGNV